MRDREVVSGKSGIIEGRGQCHVNKVSKLLSGEVSERQRLGQLHGRGEGASLGVQRPLLLKM